jgi:hypothetical protein
VLTDEDKRCISERLEKVETNLLTEFHKWASPVELRQRSRAAVLRALDTEVESLSDRLKNLEGRWSISRQNFVIRTRRCDTQQL